jgi:hypothetical protein
MNKKVNTYYWIISKNLYEYIDLLILAAEDFWNEMQIFVCFLHSLITL